MADLAAGFDPKTQALFNHKGYVIEKKLGAGAFGTVYKALHTASGTYTAVKVMDLSKMNESFRQKFLPRELQALIMSKHENLVQVWDIFRADNKVWIFMEFAGNGDIAEYVKKNKDTSSQLMAAWFLQASHGLQFLHEKLYCTHRDIKLDNILLNESWVAKLSDFGFAKVCVNQLHKLVVMCRTFCGTVPYKSPQLLAKKPYNGFKADVWAMGTSFYIMLHRRFPFHFKDREQMLAEAADYPTYIRGRYKKDLPEEAATLLDGMLHPEEKDRWTIKQVVSHAWLISTAAHGTALAANKT